MLLCAALALWVDLGGFHCDHCGDSILPVVTSLYRWTPYFWECNRIGMLVPLLAMPIRHPLANLLVQSGLVLFAAMTAFFLLPHYVLRNRNWPVAGVATATLFFLLPRGTRFFYTFGQPHYLVSAALGLGALILVERRGAARLAGGVALVLLAHWVNSATTAALAPLVVLRHLIGPAAPAALQVASKRNWFLNRELVLALCLLGVGCAGALASRFVCASREDPLATALTSPHDWPEGWRQLGRGTWEALTDREWTAVVSQKYQAVPRRWTLAPVCLALGLLLAVLFFVVRHAFTRARRRGLKAQPEGTPIHGARGCAEYQPAAIKACGALIASGAVYAIFTGMLEWTASNLYHWKYWIPSVLYWQSAAGVAMAALLSRRFRARSYEVGAIALIVAAASAYGLPSLARVRADIEASRGRGGQPPGYIAARTSDVLASRCTHVAGHYDEAWLTVFQANLDLYERGEGRVVWAMASRCLAAWDLWGCLPIEDLRVAGLTVGGDLDPDAACFLNTYCPPMSLVDKMDGIWVYCPTAEAPPSKPTAQRDEAVLASWHSGFFPLEGSSQSNNRWCRAQGKLTLTNLQDRPQVVALEMSLVSGGSARGHVWIEDPCGAKRLVVCPDGVPYHRTLVVPPGRLTVRFSCDAPTTSLPRDNRSPLVFRVVNFRMTQLSEGPSFVSARP
jgi:hypothetical protein